jgi:holo-[acyl-carrier protein] synthase
VIVGLGIDMVEVPRIAAGIKRQGARFVARIAHPEDLKNAPKATSSRAPQYWAARFAVKEAFAKALGTGLGETVRLKYVGISKTSLGCPELSLAPKLKAVLKKRGITGHRVSITHTAQMAVAVVVLEGTST